MPRGRALCLFGFEGLSRRERQVLHSSQSLRTLQLSWKGSRGKLPGRPLKLFHDYSWIRVTWFCRFPSRVVLWNRVSSLQICNFLRTSTLSLSVSSLPVPLGLFEGSTLKYASWRIRGIKGGTEDRGCDATWVRELELLSLLFEKLAVEGRTDCATRISNSYFVLEESPSSWNLFPRVFQIVIDRRNNTVCGSLWIRAGLDKYASLKKPTADQECGGDGRSKRRYATWPRVFIGFPTHPVWKFLWDHAPSFSRVCTLSPTEIVKFPALHFLELFVAVAGSHQCRFVFWRFVLETRSFSKRTNVVSSGRMQKIERAIRRNRGSVDYDWNIFYFDDDNDDDDGTRTTTDGGRRVV